MSLRAIALGPLALLALASVPVVAGAAGAGSAFTYQGLLRSGGAGVTGSYDFDFRLFSDSTGATQIGSDQFTLGVVVQGGLFTVPLDFGAAAFDGNARWLDIRVRASGAPAYTALAPRQPVTATPYAVRALNGPSGASQWSNDANGIEYAGNIGLGAASRPDWRLYVETGSTNVNPLVVRNNNASYSALFVENDASAGYGIYSPPVTSHYLGGHVGIGTTPAAWATLNVGNAGQGVASTVSGSRLNPGYNAAVVAIGNTGTGLTGTTSMGVYSASSDDRGVWGLSTNNLGVVGDNTSHGNSGWLGGVTEGVFGQATSTSSYGGRFVNSAANGVALRVDGMGQVKTLQILGGADLAERFEVPDGVEPGTVMAIDPGSPGRLEVARGAYCATVAGVVSGANGLEAGVELGRGETRAGTAPIALSGRVWVRCDASHAAIRSGDLLTTADRAGYAMRATDARRAGGAVLGKAMTSLASGTGYVLVLVSLQ